MEECTAFIKLRREARHNNTLERQTAKYNRLCHKNTGGCLNIQDGSHDKQSGSASQKQEEDSINSPDTGEMRTKWVINISSKPLTAVQESLLTHGTNYSVVLRSLSLVECVTAVEKVCQKLTPGEADELRVEVKAILKKTPPPRHNLTKDEQNAIGELKRDKTRVVLTADKGVSLVVMDKEQYIKKAEELLNQLTYKTLQNDPTTKYKKKLISLLKNIKTEGGISEALYRRLYPTGAGSAIFYGLPKVDREGIPLRPIVSSTGAATMRHQKSWPGF